MHVKRTRILFESTGTFGTPLNTGIQRVVRSVIREAGRMDEDGVPQVVPVVFRNGQFFDGTGVWNRIIRRQDRGGHATWRRLKVAIERVSPSAARCYGAAATRLRKLLYPKSPLRAASRVYWQTLGRPIVFHPDDVLLLLDASWGHSIWPSVREARQLGCRVGAVVYDLLPVEYPQFFKPPFSDVFADWLKSLTDHGDFFLTISDTVRASLESYLESSRSPKVTSTKQCQSFLLGADVPRSSSVIGVRSRLRQLFRGDRGSAPYLAVGTVEPRKNHRYLLDAFELLWQRYPSAKLCVIGRIGWQCRDLLDRIAHHPQMQKSLFVFHDLSDNELHFCYERAKALVTASVAEGFGLPIVEALCHDLPVFASDIPVHREVGGHGCRYFDLHAARSLAALLGDVEQEGLTLTVPDGRRDAVTTWSESCRDLLTKTMRLAAAVSADRLPEVDVPLRSTGKRARAA